MDKIEIVCPNVHAYEFDLSKFKSLGFTENREVSGLHAAHVYANLCTPDYIFIWLYAVYSG